MAGPAVVDKAKMVFHYVAKLGPSECAAPREMKVCFRHSKHSIKCDISAPCPECDSGLKLYSYDQCRRHLDVVRAERRFESIEVDRAEDQIEKMHELDDNGKRVLQLLDVLHARLEAGREEERAWRESTCGALREVSASCARALHKTEELAEWARAAAEHVALSDVTALVDESRKQTALLERHLEAGARHHQMALEELRALRAGLAPLEGALRAHTEALASRVSGELERMRSEAAAEVRALHETLRHVRDQLPERLVDAFGGLLLLSQDKEERERNEL